MIFLSSADYITAWDANSGLAIVPIPLAADHLKVSSATVTAMTKSGRLEAVRIGRNQYILLYSITAHTHARENAEAII